MYDTITTKTVHPAESEVRSLENRLSARLLLTGNCKDHTAGFLLVLCLFGADPNFRYFPPPSVLKWTGLRSLCL